MSAGRTSIFCFDVVTIITIALGLSLGIPISIRYRSGLEVSITRSVYYIEVGVVRDLNFCSVS
jgi:hypothetical protein